MVLETLRKYPPLPVLHRKCTKDCTIDEVGLTVEKGERTIISTLALHYDPEYFPDPEKFDPERFSEENKSNITPFTYLPFGDGPRNCIGKCPISNVLLNATVLFNRLQGCVLA